MTDTPTPRELPMLTMDAEGVVRPATLIEELDIEGSLVPARRGWLYRTAAAELAADDARIATLERDLAACRAALRELVAVDELTINEDSDEFNDQMVEWEQRYGALILTARALVGQEGDGHDR